MILRDPVERLFSQHAEAVANGQARPDFLAWVEQQARGAAWQPPMGAVWNGFYARHPARYRDCFPAQRHQQIFRYEDYVAAPHE